MKRASMLLAMLALIYGAVEAKADLILYNNSAVFAAAATGVKTIGFEGIAAPNGFVNYGHGGSISLNGITFTAGNAYLYVESSGSYQKTFGTPYNLQSGDFLMSGNGRPSSLHVTIPGGSKQIAFDLGTFDRTKSLVSVALSTGDRFTLSAPYPTTTFIGFSSKTPITSLDLLITGGERKDTLSLDNFSFGPVQGIPEPTSLTLFSLGAIGYGWLRWKKSASKQSGSMRHSPRSRWWDNS
jgi:PEP-CTERM motif